MMHHRYPVTDRERDRATIEDVLKLTALAFVAAVVIWWVWLR
jgi:hypothetical protein